MDDSEIYDALRVSTPFREFQLPNPCVCPRSSVDGRIAPTNCYGTCHIPVGDEASCRDPDYTIAKIALRPNQCYLDRATCSEISDSRWPEKWGYLLRYPSPIARPIITPTDRQDDVYLITLGYSSNADFGLDPDPCLEANTPRPSCSILCRKVSTLKVPMFIYAIHSSHPNDVKVGFRCLSKFMFTWVKFSCLSSG